MLHQLIIICYVAFTAPWKLTECFALGAMLPNAGGASQV